MLELAINGGMSMNALEKSLDSIFGAKAPVQLPENAKKTIVEWLPWITLVLGLIQLWAAWALWQLGHWTNALVDYSNSFYQAVGAKPIAPHLSIFFWVALLVLVADAALMLVAFPGLKAKSKAKGWNLLFYSTVLNAVYGIVRLFTSLGSGFGSFFGAIIGTVLGLYFLFQIRSHYNGVKASTPKPEAPAK